ncbi:MAG: UvrD-helicase domain-containing protein [bacterium]
MDEILTSLNIPQKEAVTSLDGTLLVLAGAGSGKTRVLTSRIAHLVSNGVYPAEIFAVTFTNKAAKEMKQRIINILGENTIKNLWIGTFHSICGRILRQEIENYKTEDNRSWQRNFVIFDQNDTLNLIKQAIKIEDLDDKTYQPQNVQNIISMAKNKMMDAYKFATYARDFRSENIARVFDTYEKLLSTNNALDFDDLLLTTVNLLSKSTEILQKYHSRFKHILVDEFQDTNLVQYKLISMLYNGSNSSNDSNNNNENNTLREERSLCVVGDIDQSIYSWRGADYKILLNFRKDFPDASLIKLEQNYRSTENILEAANHIIINNRERLAKNLYTTKEKGDKILCFEADDEAEEAHYIVNKIEKLKSKNYNYSNCVVLYRTNAQSRAIEEAFMARSIPYSMIGGVKFYERKEIKDLIAYLKVIYNQSDSQSLKRIINVPRRSIGQTTLKKIEEISVKESVSFFSAIERAGNYSIFTSKIIKSLNSFILLINKLKEISNKIALSKFIALLIEEIGYLEELKAEATEEANNRIENIYEFISVAREYEDFGSGELGEFLAQVSLVSDIDTLGENSENVTLMTLHAAKGLEYPIVFLAGLEDGIFPHMRSLNNPSSMEEERRLMYVGVTRAEELLYLTYTKRRLIYGDYKYNIPSRFLKEIPQHLLITKQSQNSAKKLNVSTKPKFMGHDQPIDYSTTFGKNFVAPKIQR